MSGFIWCMYVQAHIIHMLMVAMVTETQLTLTLWFILLLVGWFSFGGTFHSDVDVEHGCCNYSQEEKYRRPDYEVGFFAHLLIVNIIKVKNDMTNHIYYQHLNPNLWIPFSINSILRKSVIFDVNTFRYAIDNLFISLLSTFLMFYFDWDNDFLPLLFPFFICFDKSFQNLSFIKLSSN